VSVFSLKVKGERLYGWTGVGGWPNNMSALGRHIFPLFDVMSHSMSAGIETCFSAILLTVCGFCV